MTIVYVNRVTGKEEEEHVYGENALRLLYGEGPLSKLIGAPLSYIASRSPLWSAFYGFLQKSPTSRKKIFPFIEKYHVDSSEFLMPPESFSSFNDFFIRKLKSEARPIIEGSDMAAIPADGRYYFYQNMEEAEGFIVKGQKFSLASLLQDNALAAAYAQGSMLIARLCPTDYHRFHFPCDNIPQETQRINGWLYSVNPIAVKKNIKIFTENKRTLCRLQTERFGQVLFLEIGATNVGSILQTYRPHTSVKKGSEKGFFSFGASALILIFPPKSILFDDDLRKTTLKNLEIKCLMGQSLGHSLL